LADQYAKTELENQGKAQEVANTIPDEMIDQISRQVEQIIVEDVEVPDRPVAVVDELDQKQDEDVCELAEEIAQKVAIIEKT